MTHTMRSSDTSEAVALIADIGGTHARFAIVRADGDYSETRIVADTEATDCVALCQMYLDQLSQDYTITRAAWAVAGPVTGDVVTITNRGWTFSRHALQQHFGWTEFFVVNDFAALALSLPHLAETDLKAIKSGTPDGSAPFCVIGPGTGLGVAALVPLDDNRWHVLPGEGGHVALAAVDAAEQTIIDRLHKRLGYVAAEHVLSGRGLVNLAQAMDPACVWQTPHEISALIETDPQAQAVFDQFCAFLGTVAGDAALTLGARGGVYLAGGILPRFAERLAQSRPIQRFEEKYAVKAYQEAIPIWLITHPLPAFVGLQSLLKTQKV
jgi:glucokinase